jgi:hypothetical protein
MCFVGRSPGFLDLPLVDDRAACEQVRASTGTYCTSHVTAPARQVCGPDLRFHTLASRRRGCLHCSTIRSTARRVMTARQSKLKPRLRRGWTALHLSRAPTVRAAAPSDMKLRGELRGHGTRFPWPSGGRARGQSFILRMSRDRMAPSWRGRCDWSTKVRSTTSPVVATRWRGSS